MIRIPSVYIPPNGYVGQAQQTTANQLVGQVFGGRRRSANGKRRRRKAAASAPVRRRRRSAKSGRKARLVKGSAAAKRYMAKIRRMRKR